MDIIIYNGEIRTMDGSRPVVQAIGIKDGLIACIGDDNEVLARKTPVTEIIDAGGRCVIPGLNDSHMHLLGYAAGKDGADLTSARSIDDIITILKAHISAKCVPEGTVVTGGGFNENMFADKNSPSRRELDMASDKHPICIVRACRHVCVVNSLMIERSGIRPDMAVDGGEVLLYPDGTLSGVLTENAMDLPKTNKGPMPTERIKELLRLAAPGLAAVGITSVQTDDFYPMFTKENVMEAYTSLAREGGLTFRVTEQCRAFDVDECRVILSLPQPIPEIQPMFRLGPVKLFADGSLGARTAFMREDYHDAPGVRGVAIYTRAALNELVWLIHSGGRDAAIHAIGDGTINMALDAIESAQTKHPRPDARHGIVHAQITTPDLLERFKSLKVMAFIQPIFIHADAPIAARRVGTEKAATSYAFKTLLDTGVHIPTGTDCPVEPFDPFDNIYCAVTRKGLTGDPPEGFNPDQALSVEEAVRAYTTHSAYASREEHVKGKLVPGFYADLAILSRNIFAVSPEAIPGTKSDITIVGGKIITR
ncbi:MAG: amidohydrolase [Defluviitaleaceae bacterium]|nr:amidohydrolase [Defluviitaleaceae bacterium]MCL2835372.1 amidohydrolase [Defluviitaleaceae bacterium]